MTDELHIYIATQRDNERKCPVLFLREWPHATVQTSTESLKRILAGEDLSVLVDMKLNTSKQFSLGIKGVNSTLACDRKIVASRSREVSLPF